MNPTSPHPDPDAADSVANIFFAVTLLTCLAFAGWIFHKVL